MMLLFGFIIERTMLSNSGRLHQSAQHHCEPTDALISQPLSDQLDENRPVFIDERETETAALPGMSERA
jgi:hypothetical protein